MENTHSGIERRLSELNERLQRLEPLRTRPQSDFEADPYLRDIVERNLEVAAQCCIDICHRIINLENARKPLDYYEAFIILSEMGVLPIDFAKRIAPLAGLRNILVHEYLGIDWNHVYQNLQNLQNLIDFSEYIRAWLLA
jgi:uncharacterized protein YutE (UPF0331/DUF86 family)